ncbi:MAG: choice-of-anchor A family protein, partial [Ruminococcus sp.]|nr:choice-of-anchor A family protein [Ruminococcus sp.]
MNKLKTRSISFITAFMMSIMSIVTGISPPTFAANPVPNASGTKETDDVTLLVGKDSKLKGNDIASTIKNYDKAYALGIASQFCIFLEGDFTPSQSDAEGRVAVGGNIDISNTDRHEYELGNGDFVNHVGLDALTENSGFAHAIINGTANGLIPTSWNQYSDADGNLSYPAKKFWVSDEDAIKEVEKYNNNFGMWGNSGDATRWTGTYADYVYPGSMAFDVAKQFDEIRKRSKTLANKKATGTFEIKEDTINGQTEKVAYLDASSYGEVCDTVYFHLTKEQWEEMSSVTKIEFVNVPKLKEPRTVIETTGENKYEKQTWDYANIVVTVDGIGTKEEPVEISKQYINNQTWINGISVSKKAKNLDGSGDEKKNNNAGVTSLLYNFHEAEYLVLGKDFQGTILAPKADTVDKSFVKKGESYNHDPNNPNYVNGFVEGAELIKGENTNSNGHLSGALIAKSFKGGTEFGYRPYEGASSILGSVSGYALDFTKIDDNGDPLLGATIGLVLSDDATGEVVSDVETTKDKYNFITLPSSIDDSVKKGDKIEKTYTLKEISAPAGYNKTEDTYPVRIVENIQDTIKINDTVLPTKVEVSVYRGDKNATTAPDNKRIRHLVYVDEFDADGNQTKRTITITSHIDGLSNEGEDVPIEITFTLDIDNGTITEVTQLFEGKETNPFEVNETTNPNNLTVGTSGIFNVKWNGRDSHYYYDVDNMMITRIPAGNVPEFINEPKDITLIKYEKGTDGKTRIKDVEFKLYKEDGTPVEFPEGEDGKTDAEGKINLGHLIPGQTYYLLENPESVKEPYIPFDKDEKIFFTVNNDYTISGATYDSFEVDYTLNYADGTTAGGTKTVGKNEPFNINDVAIKSKNLKTDHFSKTIDNEGYDAFTVQQWFNTDNPENYNVDFSGKKINKIVVNVKSVSGGSIQFKKPENWGGDGTKLEVKLKEGANEIKPSDFANSADCSFADGGYMAITAWGAIIESIDYYVDEFTYTGIDPKELESITVKIPETAEANYVQFYNDKTYDGVKNADGTYTIKVGEGITSRWPTLGLDLEDTRPVINSPAGSDVVRVPNEKEAPKENFILINKRNVHGHEVDGAEIKITSTDPDFKFTKENYDDLEDGEAKDFITWTSAEESRAVIKNLPAGDYIMEETSAPNGYLIATRIKFTIDEDGKISSAIEIDENDNKIADITETNVVEVEVKGREDKVPGLKMIDESFIKISKKDMGGEPLPGAVFTLTRQKTDGTNATFDKTKLVYDENYVSFREDDTVIRWNSNGISDTDNKIPDKAELEIRNLLDGNYTLHEVSAPDGYQLAADVKFTIENGVIKINKTAVEDNNIVVTDKDAEIRLMKRAFSGTINLPVPGAHMSLTGVKTGTTDPIVFTLANVVIGDTVKGKILSEGETTETLEWITGEKELTIKNIPDGTYTYHEVSAPKGYEKSTDITFDVNNGVIDLTTVKIKDSFEENATSIDYKYATAGSVTMYDRKIVGISKQDAEGNLVSGATLVLKGTQTVKVKDEDGTEQEKVQDVTFSASNIHTETADIKVDILDKDGKESVPDADGKVSGVAVKWTSDGENNLELMGLPDGKYTLEETKVPEGYEQAEIITFEIKDQKIENVKNGTLTPNNAIIMIDNLEEDKEISINKVDADGNDLEGATLILTGKQIITDESGPDSEGEIEGRTIEFDSTNVADTTAKVIDENGEEITADGKGIAIQWVSDGEALVLKNLPDGKYTLEETVVPDGYTKAEDITFTVNVGDITEIDGKTVTDNKIDVTDNVSSIHISKKEVGGKDELPGATLKLTLTKADEEDATLENITVKQGETELIEEEGLEVSEDKKSVSFVSVEEFDTVFEKLPDGTYTLEETEVPQEDGENTHEQAENITFVIKNGVITSITLSDNDKENYKISDDEYENTVVSGSTATGVVMRDATTTTTSESSSTTITTTTAFTVRIDKVDETGTRVTGAKLSLTGTDEDGNPIVFNEENASKTYLVTGESSSTTTTTTTTESGASSDETKETVTATKLAWISGDKEVVFNLPAGTYVLHEDEAPTDYEKAEEITFIVDDEGNIIVVTEVKDEEGNTTKDEEGNIITATATTDKIQMTDIKITTSSTSSSTTTTTTTITTATVNIVKIGSDSSTTIRNLKGATLSLTGQDGTTPIVFGEEYKDYFTAPSTTSTSSTSTTSGVTTTTEGIAVQADEDVSTSSALSSNTSTDISVSSTTGTTADDTKETVTATKLIWISGEKAFPIGLPAGEYTLHEESAPDGYKESLDIVFTVDEEGNVTRKDGIEVKDDNTIEMIDEKVTTSTTTTTTSTTTTTTSTTTT